MDERFRGSTTGSTAASVAVVTVILSRRVQKGVLAPCWGGGGAWTGGRPTMCFVEIGED